MKSRTQQPPVQWMSLPALWQRTKWQILAHIIGRFVDPREAFAPLDASVAPPDGGGVGADVWVDYVADVGDGYQATRAVAFCQSRPLGETIPGDLLIFGGDQVYPVASRRAYERRFRAPYDDDLVAQRAQVLALPGNHDWYDMLQSFPEIFTRGRSTSLANAAQRCSYWSRPVPGGSWWIWGLDFGLTGDLDEAQRTHFARQREELAARDGPIGLVICTAEPFWQKGKAAIAASVEQLIPSNTASVLHISGDKHHLAVWQDDTASSLERERIYVTAGGGGAYLALTDDVPATVPMHPVPPPGGGGGTARPSQPPPNLQLRDVYPRPRAWKARSLAPALGPRGWRLDQLGLLPVLGAAYLVLGGLLSVAAADDASTGVPAFDWATRGSWPNTWWRLLGAAAGSGWCRAGALAVLVALVGLAVEKGKGAPIQRATLGAAHALAHGAAAIAVAAAAMEVAASLDGAGRGLLYVVLLGVVGAFVGNAIFVGYLVVAARRGFNLNEAAATIASPHQKNFVRLHFSPDGALEVIPFTIERTDKEADELLASCQQRTSYRLIPNRPPSMVTCRRAAR